MPSAASTRIPQVARLAGRLGRVHTRRSRDGNEIIEVALAYADGRPIQRLYDADYHVVWSALIPRPLVRVVHPDRVAVAGGEIEIGGWVRPLEKVQVLGHDGVYYEFEPNPPVTARSALMYNAIQWFEGPIFHTIQGYEDLDGLLDIADSLR